MFKIFELSLRLNGFPIRKAKAALDAILNVPENEYEAFTAQKKREIVDYHLQNNPFYKSIAKQGFSNWEDLPVMTKKDFQRPLEERLSSGFTKKNVYINKTSGSGGIPVIFAKDKMCHAMVWANIMRRFAWYDIDLNHSLQARFYGRGLNFPGSLLLNLKDYLSNRHRFDIFDFSASAQERLLKKFSKKKFDYINGYTSSIVLVAKYLKEKNVVLTSICPTLKACIVTSEMLFPSDKILLEKWLGVPVVNEYGVSETEIIAFENPNGIWEMNTENIFVEILDEDNTVLPDGEEGRIVVTALYNKAHPFIRYDVGDYGIISRNGTAKHRVLEKLIGRTNDVAILPSGKKPSGMTFFSITKALFDDDDKVKEFVITQIKLDTFKIDYTSKSLLNTSEIANLEKTMTQFLEPGLTFIFERHDKLQRTKSGKLKQFTSLVRENVEN